MMIFSVTMAKISLLTFIFRVLKQKNSNAAWNSLANISLGVGLDWSHPFIQFPAHKVVLVQAESLHEKVNYFLAALSEEQAHRIEDELILPLIQSGKISKLSVSSLPDHSWWRGFNT